MYVDDTIKRLRILRSSLGKSRRDFCKMLDIPYNTFLCWDSGRTKLTPSGARKICDGLKKFKITCSMEWLLCDDTYKDFDPKGEDVMKELDLVLNMPAPMQEHEISLTVSDAAMCEFEVGEFLSGVVVHDVERIQNLIGQCIMCEIRKNHVLVRKLYPGTEVGKYSFVATNPAIRNPIIFNSDYLKIGIITGRYVPAGSDKLR